MIDLTEYADAVNAGLAQGTPCVLSTVGKDGMPNLGLKGSVLVFDKDHLAYWERTRKQHFENVQGSDQVAILYVSFPKQKYLRFFGKAELHENDALRQQIMDRTVAPELERDPERKGVGVLVRVDKIIEGFGGATKTRD